MDLLKRVCFLVCHTRVLTVQTQETAKQTKLNRQLDSAKLAPSVKLNIIFSTSNKLIKLCKLKCKLPISKQSNVIYKVACGSCTEFYIGKTNRRLLQTCLNEQK